MSNITLAEITRQSNRIKEQLEKYGKASNSIINNLNRVASYADNAEDSSARSLVRSVNTASSTLKKLSDSIDNSFTYLYKVMDEYVTKSSQNEEETTKSIKSLINDFEETVQRLKTQISLHN